MMKKVLCIGDSLALPGHLNLYEDTWFYLLKKEFPKCDFISFFKRQLTTDVLISQGGGDNGVDKWPKGGDCLEAYLPSIVIIQLGIVDSAPRLLTMFDRLVLKLLPKLFVKSYISFVKKVRSRKVENTRVTIEKFKENLIEYIERAEKIVDYLIFISISIPDDRILVKSPDIVRNVELYNNVIEELGEKFSFVSVTKPLSDSVVNELVYEDGYHPNQEGHKIIFSELKDIFDGIV